GAGEAARHPYDGDVVGAFGAPPLARPLLRTGGAAAARQIAVEIARGRVLEKAGYRDVEPVLLTQAGQHLHRQQRAATELEEIVLGADRLEAQHLRKDRAHRALDVGTRRHRWRARVRPLAR